MRLRDFQDKFLGKATLWWSAQLWCANGLMLSTSFGGCIAVSEVMTCGEFCKGEHIIAL